MLVVAEDGVGMGWSGRKQNEPLALEGFNLVQVYKLPEPEHVGSGQSAEGWGAGEKGAAGPGWGWCRSLKA